MGNQCQLERLPLLFVQNWSNLVLDLTVLGKLGLSRQRVQMKTPVTIRKFLHKPIASHLMWDELEKVLKPLGFIRCDGHGSKARFQAPGMNSTRLNPLRGATTIEVLHSNNEVIFQADLGGLKQIRTLLTWLPAGLGIFFFLMVLIGGYIGGLWGKVPLWNDRINGYDWFVYPLVLGMTPVLPWIFITPLMIKRLRKKFVKAFEELADISLGETRKT